MSTVLTEFANGLTSSGPSPSALDGSFQIVRCALGVGSSEAPIIRFGFGCHPQASAARRKAFFEVVERVLTTPGFYTPEELHQKLPRLRYATMEIVGEDARQNNLVGQVRERKALSGNGCAVGPDFRCAASHAMLEYLERDLCGRLWHGMGPEFQMETQNGVRGERNYTIESELVIMGRPYHLAIVMIVDDASSVFAAGSALKTNRRVSRQHARGEALMLVEDAIQGRNGHAQQRSAKVLALRDPDYIRATEEHLTRLSSMRIKQNPEWGAAAEKGEVSLLYEDTAIAAVRYHNDALDEIESPPALGPHTPFV